MNNILLIKTSLNGEQSQSNTLATQLITQLAGQSGTQATERDVAAEPLPHLTQEEMAAWASPANQRSPQQQALAALSDTLIAELQQADTVVIAMPMYNFGVPSNFKAWVDRVARAGVTFRYTEQGPQGLLANKKVIVVATRGGVYQGTSKDTQTPYLQNVLGFIGITNVQFIYAEGLNMPQGEQALAQAKASISEFAA